MSRRAPLAVLRAAALPLLAAAACSPATPEGAMRETAASTPPAATAGTTAAASAEAFGEWRPLFDGRSLAGWRGFRSEQPPAGWQAVEGSLVRVGGGGDLLTVEEFDDFELALDWKVEPGGNSGVMFRVARDGDETYHTGPEMQVLDDAGHADGRSRLTAAGSAYGLYPAPEGVVRPAGEWNEARLLVHGSHVEQWLNGTKTAEYEIGSPDWERRVRESKFAAWPRYGRVPRGHIVLQDHGDRVEYRNVRIRTPR